MKKEVVQRNIVLFLLFIAILFQAVDYFYYENVFDYKLFNSQGANPNVVFAKPNDVTIPTEAEVLKGKNNLEIFKYYVKSQKYVMHAGGSINKTYYTNSFEAIDKNYQDGNRIFEIDLNFSSDGDLVLIHSWDAFGYQSILKKEYPGEVTPMSTRAFKNTKISGQFTSMTIKDLINYMKKNPYCYFILNLKQGSKVEVTKKGLQTLVKAANYDKKILNRFVIWGYNTKVIETAKSIFNFELITFSYRDPKDLPKDLDSYQKIVNYCKKNKITSLIMANGSYDEEMVKLAKKNEIFTFIFTVDNEKTANNYFHSGVDMVLSNKLVNEKTFT